MPTCISYLGSGGEYLGKERGYSAERSKIAQLDLFKLNNTLVQNKNSLAQATLEMQDVLIGQGYAPDNLKVIPADVLELAKVKAGMSRAKLNMNLLNMIWNKLR